MSFMDTTVQKQPVAYADLPYLLEDSVKRLQKRFNWPDMFVEALNLRLQGTKAEDIAGMRGKALGTIGEKLMKIRNDLGITACHNNPFLNAQEFAKAILRADNPLEKPEIEFESIPQSAAKTAAAPRRRHKRSMRPEDRRQAPEVPMPDEESLRQIFGGDMDNLSFEVLAARMRGDGVSVIAQRIGTTHQTISRRERGACMRLGLPLNRDRGPGSAKLHAADLRLAAWRRIEGSRPR